MRIIGKTLAQGGFCLREFITLGGDTKVVCIDEAPGVMLDRLVVNIDLC